MASFSNNDNGRVGQGTGSSDRKSGGKLLLMEPAPLLRWSLATYLARWFEVIPSGERRDAEELLRANVLDALVISDELDECDVEWIETQARKVNEHKWISECSLVVWRNTYC